MTNKTSHLVLMVPLSGAPSEAAVKLDELEKNGYKILLIQGIADRPVAQSKLLIVAKQE